MLPTHYACFSEDVSEGALATVEGIAIDVVADSRADSELL